MTQPHQPGQAVFRSVPPEDIVWKAFPAFPPSVRLAIIVGEPAEPAPYLIRVKMPAGERLMPLAHGTCSSKEAYKLLQASSPRELFSGSRAPEAAMAGLWLYFSCLDEAHTLAQAVETADGSFWHGIMHRQEPDAGKLKSADRALVGPGDLPEIRGMGACQRSGA